MLDDIAEAPEKASHAANAYDEVLRRLRGGMIKPGDRIVDKALAVELDMSRMPAREALLRLVTEGYLVGSTRGFRLPQLSVQDILDIFDLRCLLEPRAAAAAALHMDDDALARLSVAYASATSAYERNDAADMNQAHADFRAVWIDAVPNRRHAGIVSRFFDQVYAIRGATLHDAQTRLLSITMLTAVFDAFHTKDPLAVNDRMNAFIEASRLSFLAKQDEYALLAGSDD